MPGRVEFRSKVEKDGPDYTSGARFLPAGLRYGAKYATEEERARVETATMLRITPLDSHWKETDLAIGRTIESLGIIPSDPVKDRQLFMFIDTGYVKKAIEALTGRKIKDEDHKTLGKNFFSYGLELTPNGFLQTSEQLLASVLRHSPAEQHVGVDDIPRINAKLRRFAITPTERIFQMVQFSGDPLAALHSATAFPLVAPADHAELVAAFSKSL
jgi:hypothetical protein